MNLLRLMMIVCFSGMIAVTGCQPNSSDESDAPGQEPQSENEAPVITLVGASSLTLDVGDDYVEMGAIGNDPEDGDISDLVQIDDSDVDTMTAGVYYVTYNLRDSEGLDADTILRTVVVTEVSSMDCSLASVRCVGPGAEYDTNIAYVEEAFQAAADDAQPGDTIKIRGGTYRHDTASPETFFLTVEASGTAELPITIEPFDGETVAIEGFGFPEGTEGPSRKDERLIYVTGDHVHIRGIELANSSRWGLVINGDFGLYEGLIIRDSWQSNVIIRADGDTVEGNILRNIESYRSRHGSGFFMVSTSGSPQIIRDNVIEDCLAYDNGYQPDGEKVPSVQGDDDGGGNSDGINAFKGCHDDRGVYSMANLCPDNTFRGNITWHNADDGFDVSFGLGSSVVDNISFDNGPMGNKAYKVYAKVEGGITFLGNIAMNQSSFAFEIQFNDYGDVYHNTSVHNSTAALSVTDWSNAGNSEIINNMTAFSGSDLRDGGGISQLTNHWQSMDGDPMVANPSFTADSVEIPSAGSSVAQKHLAIRNQFKNALTPDELSPLIDAGTFISGVHCAYADDDPVNGDPEAEGCRHWSGLAPDIGAVESVSEDEPGCTENCDRPWEALVDQIVGFGSGTTGGKGADFCRVTTLAASGVGSLRACAEQQDPAWIVFDVSGQIDLEEAIDVQSNKTIDGRGADITLTGDGLLIEEGVENIIVHNIRIADALTDKNRDAITITEDVQHVWIDHCDLSNFTDGLVDITVRSTDITLSWNHFHDHGKAVLISADDSHTFDDIIRVTLHHNFFDGVDERSPRLRFGKVHAFNNYVRNWLYYGMRSAVQGQLFAQNNIFQPAGDNDAVESLNGGYIKAEGNLLLDGAQIEVTGSENVFDPGDYYAYDAETADLDLRDRLITQTGWQEVPLPEGD